MNLSQLNATPADELRELFMAVCHSSKWSADLGRSAPFDSLQDLQSKAQTAWAGCGPDDWKESLAGHPRIGQRQAGSDLAAKWSQGEQSSAARSDEAIKLELAQRQAAYEDRFGFLFLICASGLSSAEILEALNKRMEQSPEGELQTMAKELAKIIDLRLEKLLDS